MKLSLKHMKEKFLFYKDLTRLKVMFFSNMFIQKSIHFSVYKDFYIFFRKHCYISLSPNRVHAWVYSLRIKIPHIQGEKNYWLHSKTMAFYLVSSLVPIQVNIRHLSDCFIYAPVQKNKIVNTATPISFFGQRICVYQKLQDDFAWTNFTHVQLTLKFRGLIGNKRPLLQVWQMTADT